jgi:hypothetical protein
MVEFKTHHEPQMDETAVQQTVPTTTVEEFKSGRQPQLDDLHNGREPEMVEDRERSTGQRDEGGIDRASGIELVHPRQPRVRRQHHSIAESQTGIELSTHEGRQRGHADRAVSQAERARGAGRHRVRLGEAVLPQFGELHGRKRRDREPAENLLCAHFHAAAEEIAAEAARRRLGRADARNAARLAVAERAEAQRPRRIERTPRLDAVAAEVRPLEMAAGDAVADREIGATAADGEAGQQIGTELIIEPAREPAGVVGEVGAPDACFARELEGAVKARKPRPPPRLVWRGRGHFLEGHLDRLVTPRKPSAEGAP